MVQWLERRFTVNAPEVHSLVESYQKTFKNAIHSFLAWRLHLVEDVGNTRQVRLLCPLAKLLMGRPHLYVEDRWPSFPSEEKGWWQEGHLTINKCHVIKMQISAVATPNRE